MTNEQLMFWGAYVPLGLCIWALAIAIVCGLLRFAFEAMTPAQSRDRDSDAVCGGEENV